jgi:thiamine-phosphate pyrophosphorylase
VAAGGDPEEALLERVRGAATAGVDWIELREKDLDSRRLLALTRKAVAVTRPNFARQGDAGAGPLLLLNDRLDVARLAAADGVHLTEASLPIDAVLRWKHDACGHDDLREFLVGASCHSLEGAQRAAGDGAGYIFFGPVFATPSKAAFGGPQGLPKLGEICRSVKIPVLAIGGVTAENARDCVAAGAAGIAAIGLFQTADDLAGLLAGLRKSLS